MGSWPLDQRIAPETTMNASQRARLESLTNIIEWVAQNPAPLTHIAESTTSNVASPTHIAESTTPNVASRTHIAGSPTRTLNR
jgi:hypothetical protein